MKTVYYYLHFDGMAIHVPYIPYHGPFTTLEAAREVAYAEITKSIALAKRHGCVGMAHPDIFAESV